MIDKKAFGKVEGKEISVFSLSNNSGMSVSIINYGAIVTNIYVKDKKGNLQDIVLGYDSLEGYINDEVYLGAIVGRFGNRIGKSRFELKGKEYTLAANAGEDHLHGGNRGFNKVVWDADAGEDSEGKFVKLTYISPDGEEGYPGEVKLIVKYILSEDNELKVIYEGTTTSATILNPTHHSYFNLSGDFTKPVNDHIIMINADSFTPTDHTQITTGEIEPVKGTPLDFRSPERIGKRIEDNFRQLTLSGGYDHNWVLNSKSEKEVAASAYDPESGRYLEVYTDQPGMQFYTGNFLDGSIKGKNNIPYNKRTGFCFEAQHFPDSPNKPHFPSVVLNKGEIYKQVTIYKFSVKE